MLKEFILCVKKVVNQSINISIQCVVLMVIAQNTPFTVPQYLFLLNKYLTILLLAK